MCGGGGGLKILSPCPTLKGRKLFLSQTRVSSVNAVQLGSSGNLAEIQRIHKKTPEKLSITDARGRCLLHVAAAKGKVNVLEYALNHGLGR